LIRGLAIPSGLAIPNGSTHFSAGFDSNFAITGKKTGNLFSEARKAAWIARFRDFNAPEQGINRELRHLVIS
jgi:hypothetical protein